MQDGNLVVIPGGAVRRTQGLRQPRQPLAHQRFNFLGRQAVGQRLHTSWVRARAQAIVQRLVGNAGAAQLALEVLMPVETELGGVREVRTELEEERAEVLVDAVEIVVVDHGGGAKQLRVAVSAMRPVPFGGAKSCRFLLGLANHHDPFPARRTRHVRGDHIVFALPLLKCEHRHLMRLGIPFNRCDKGVADGRHRGRRRDRAMPLLLEKPARPGLPLQVGDIDVQVHAVNALNFQRHVLAQGFSERKRCYTHSGSWLLGCPHGPTHRLAVLMDAVISPPSRSHNPDPLLCPSCSRQSETKSR